MERAAGTTIGRYTLVRALGEGGAGEVWEAVLNGPMGFRKPVALKLLHVTAGGERALGSLVHEGRIGASLQHPNVVATYELGLEAGAWYVAMELVRGETLSGLLARGPLPPPALVELGLQLCAGLEAIHAAGLVHRDVKPANLLVDRGGYAKLADLGVAVLTGSGAEAAGTPGYMPPEQIEGRAEPRSDLFAAGALLFQGAVGRKAFPGRGTKAMLAVMRVRQALADGLLAPVDTVLPGLAAVLERCLAFEPEDRWPSARDLGRALAGLPRVPGSSLREVVVAGAAPVSSEASRPSVSPSNAATVVLSLLSFGNLPTPPDRFLGRAEEVDELCRRVRADRLTTLHGIGGAGKTRLSIEVARALARSFEGGTWFFELAETRTAEAVCTAIARGLDLRLDPADPVRQVGWALREKGHAVVVLDNLEQVTDAVRELLPRWLELAPEAAFVCTSRRTLRVKGERTFAVGPLPVDEGVRLLRERSPVSVPDDDAAAAIVRAVEGLPLAIELAAARLRLLSPAALLERLSDQLRVLAGGERTRPDRQRSLEASLDGSYELLVAWAQAALAQLSVLAGPFTLEAAEATLDLRAFPDAGFAVHVVEELAASSLLRADPEAGRFRMLVVVRQYAARKLTGAGRTAAEERHGRFFARTGESLADLDDLVAACRRAVARGDGEIARETGARAAALFEQHGPFRPGIELLRAAATLAPSLAGPLGALLALAGESDDARLVLERGLARDPTDAWTALRLAQVLRARGDAVGAAARATEALAGHRTRGDRTGEARTLAFQGMLASDAGRPAEAVDRYEAAIAIHRAIGDTGEASVLGNLGAVKAELGRSHEAVALYEAAIAGHRARGDRRSEAIVIGNLANALADLGRGRDAELLYETALRLHRELGHRRLEGIVLGNLGLLYSELGRDEEGSALVAEAVVVQREVGDRRSLGIALGNLAGLRQTEGRSDEAIALCEEALALHRELGNRPSEAYALANLARMRADGGQHAEALALYEVALAVHREVGARRQELEVLEKMAALYRAAGRPGEAAHAEADAKRISEELTGA